MTPDEVLAARESEVLDEHPDAAVAALEKCKHAPHLRVIVQTFGAGHHVGETSVRAIDHLACKNDAGYHGPGALIAPGSKERGMHLFPDAIEFLAHQLPIVADEAGPNMVALQHTVEHKFVTWRLFDAPGAHEVGAALGALA